MAGVSTSVYKFDRVVRGQDVYKKDGLHSLTGVVKLVSRSRCGKDDKRDKYIINDRL